MGKLFETNEADCMSDCSFIEADLDVLHSRVAQLNAQNDALVREVQRLEVLCDHDAALDVLNRRGLAYALQGEISLVRRYRVVSCFIYFDLDYFKQINDCFGHGQGDHILEKLVDHISSRLRQSDHFARLGGDEFAIILSHTSREQGLRKMARVAKSIARVSKAWGPGAENLTFSAGVSEITADLPPEDIIARADELMYLSKAKRPKKS
jgi:diguanylate cyclase (GGDEF)-like protein